MRQPPHRKEDHLMRKFIIVSGAVAALVVPSTAMAGQPANPGLFGTDRANNLHLYIDGWANTTPGASEWGEVASDRAGDNGEMNRDYQEYLDAVPTHG
jgi:hypothetical protein